jgi:hypothetical protein
MTRLHVGTGGKFYRSQQVRTQGTALAFDEGRPQEVDPVQEICKWALKNLDQDQIEKLCESLSIPHRSASLEGMDGEGEGVTGYPGGRRDGPQAGAAGPWKSTLGGVKVNGAQDGWARLRDVVKREERDLSFDSIFGSDDRGQAQDSGRDDLSLDALIGGGLGYDAGESTPRYDHLGSLPPLWVTVR